MIYQQLFSAYRKKDSVNAGLIGAGNYSTAIVTQAISNPLLKIPVIADCSIESAKAAYRQAGIEENYIVHCERVSDALRGMEAGKYIVVEDPMLLMELPIDVVVEGTGMPEAGARHAYKAIRNGKHVAMINKETDSVIGPILKHLADKAGVVYTAVDGDQHGLLMGLYSWAESIGLNIICGGKYTDSEIVYDREEKVINFRETTRTLNTEELSILDSLSRDNINESLKARKEILQGYTRIVGDYDLCEMVIALNATGLGTDTPKMHFPIIHNAEIPTVLSSVRDGGILNENGVIEVVPLIKGKNESSMGGGVFLVVSCDNNYSRDILCSKHHVVNSSGTAILISRPYHLCGVETSTTILCAGLLGLPTGSSRILPRFDLIKKTTRDMKKGEIIGGDHDWNVEGKIVPAVRVSDYDPLPAHMLNGNKVNRDIAAGTWITAEMIDAPSDSVLWSLRKQQDKMFLSPHDSV